MKRTPLIALLAISALASHPVFGSKVYGDPKNFDAFNDTGQETHGFEIELDNRSRSDPCQMV